MAQQYNRRYEEDILRKYKKEKPKYESPGWLFALIAVVIFILLI